jgi:hypothetical protein
MSSSPPSSCRDHHPRPAFPLQPDAAAAWYAGAPQTSRPRPRPRRVPAHGHIAFQLERLGLTHHHHWSRPQRVVAPPCCGDCERGGLACLCGISPNPMWPAEPALPLNAAMPPSPSRPSTPCLASPRLGTVSGTRTHLRPPTSCRLTTAVSTTCTSLPCHLAHARPRG